MKNKTIYLKDYKVPVYLVDSLDLEFDIYDTYTEVTSVTKYKRNPDSTEGNILVLDGTHQELISVELNGEQLDDMSYIYTDAGLSIENFPEVGELKIISKIDPANNTALEGLYASGDLLCTQCESHGFRRITYYQDRPDVMTLFTTKITADKKKYLELLSNGNLVDSGDVDGGRHYRVWEDPFKKPAYLFALVAGDLEKIKDSFITMSGKKVDLEIFATQANIHKCDFAMESLKRAMKWDEERFGREYDLDLFMVVGVDDFNSGAMENKGLNIFNSALIFATPETATDKDYERIEAVIGHEYFHNWTGDRVTCRDWFQLSLKEGLTVFRDGEFTSDLHSRSVKRIEDVNILRNHQFKEDESPMAHPIRPESFEEISNFYTVTVYEKGAEIIKIYETLLGVEGFRKGTDLYFERHDGEAVTTEDFLKAMEDANNRDLSQIQNWYDQAGTPLVEVTDEYDSESQTYTLKMKQSCPDTPESSNKKPFIIPIKTGLIYKDGSEEKLADDILVLTESEQVFTFKNISEKPLVSLLRGFSAPVKLKYNYSIEDYIFLMKHDSDEFNRFEAAKNFAKHVILTGENRDEFLDVYGLVLSDTSLDNSIKSLILMLPSEVELAAEQGNNVNPEEIYEKREALNIHIAERFEKEFEEIYNTLDIISEYSFESKNIADRSIKNLSLSFLSYVKNGDAAYSQYTSSNNMTDESAAFKVLVNGQSTHREASISHFIEKWKGDNNVVDKWFSIQAMSSQTSAQDIEILIQHELFDIKNPNKVRSVFNMFATYNLVNFHKSDGSGYKLIADAVIKLDSINSAIAARLVKTMMNWKSLEPKLGNLLHTELKRISEVENLSGDVSEIVEKSL